MFRYCPRTARECKHRTRRSRSTCDSAGHFIICINDKEKRRDRHVRLSPEVRNDRRQQLLMEFPEHTFRCRRLFSIRTPDFSHSKRRFNILHRSKSFHRCQTKMLSNQGLLFDFLTAAARQLTFVARERTRLPTRVSWQSSVAHVVELNWIADLV